MFLWHEYAGAACAFAVLPGHTVPLLSTMQVPLQSWGRSMQTPSEVPVAMELVFRWGIELADVVPKCFRFLFLQQTPGDHQCRDEVCVGSQPYGFSPPSVGSVTLGHSSTSRCGCDREDHSSCGQKKRQRAGQAGQERKAAASCSPLSGISLGHYLPRAPPWD